MNYLNNLTFWFHELPNKRKLSFSIAFIMIVGLSILLGFWLLSPSYAVLFTQLEGQDAQHIIKQLEEEHISYQLAHEGTDILIDKNLIAATRLKIMSSDIPISGTVGFELFDKNDWGMTDFSQKINYQRALQGELERTIATLDEVHQARVHLVIPEQHLFATQNNKPKAAITLHLKKALSPKQVHSIQQLVSSSVAHLTLKDVVIVDHFGNTLSSDTTHQEESQFSTKKKIEHHLTQKIKHMLTKIFPQQNILVSIDVSINYDELKRELITPKNHGLITHEKQSKHFIHNTASKKDKKQEISMERSYQFGSEKELFKRASGTIDRLSISVALPEHTAPKIIEQVQHLVENSVGFNKKRGDTISIAALISTSHKNYSSISSIEHVTKNKNTPTSTTSRRLSAGSSTWVNDYDSTNKAGWSILTAISQKTFLSALVLFLCFCTTGSILIRRIKQKKRQALLLELSQWLHHHG